MLHSCSFRHFSHFTTVPVILPVDCREKRNQNKTIERKKDPNTLDIFSRITDAQRHLFANKLSELPEMGKYSQGTESYQQFAIRIAEMLQDPAKFQELHPYLEKVGYR